MALPSSQMPKELMEMEAAEKAAKVEEEKRKQLVVRFSKADIFKKSMIEWYESLSKREKQHLTPLQLKRRAIYACSLFEIVYDTLPLDWLDVMKAKCGLKLYQKKKTPDSGAPVAGTAGTCNGVSSSAWDQSKTPTKRSRRLTQLKASKEGGGDNTTVAVATTLQPEISKPNDSAAKKTKRFLDLSKDPPPPFWLKCYTEGKELPRVLTVHSTEDTNILYYDYNPQLEDCFGREVKLTPQPRTSLDYFESLNFVRKSKAGEKKDN